MSGKGEDLRADDLHALAARGISEAEARRQLAILRSPPAPIRLLRPCTLGDGIERFDDGDLESLVALHDSAATAGRLLKFVPASGAATRMFRDLLALRASGCPSGREQLEARAGEGEAGALSLLRFVDEIGSFAFADELRRALADRGDDLDRLLTAGTYARILDVLLDGSGLGYGACPKGLLPFHRYGREARTAIEEHLVEASALARSGDGIGRVHFTVSPEERSAFESLVARARAAVESRAGVRLEVALSVQRPSTETLALDAAGSPLRDAGGALVFRPGGHGALLENLADLGADLVHVKNVDNVAVESILLASARWKKALTGLVVRLQGEARSHLLRLGQGPDPEAARRARDFLAHRFGVEPPDDVAEIETLLLRPIRVCGVVRNTGEPGGGPFWVAERDGRASRQIVEGAQVDARSEEQRRILAASTHFNPVDMVLGVRDPLGRSLDLRRFVDPDAVFLSWKSWEGRDLVALERPGLWNGSMAAWSTVFVEIPGETFTPVKTVFDLLRREHQPSAAPPP